MLTACIEEVLAPDIMLKLYAFYKQAVIGDTFSYDGEVDVRDAFKFNAWTQLNGMTQEDAKKQYIKLVKNILTFHACAGVAAIIYFKLRKTPEITTITNPYKIISSQAYTIAKEVGTNLFKTLTKRL